MPLIVKITLLSSLLPSALSVQSTDKAQCVDHLSFNSALQLINGISRNYLNILIAQQLCSTASVFLNKLALYLKDLQLSVFAILALKLVVSSSE